MSESKCPTQCPECKAAFNSYSTIRYPADDNRIRVSGDYECGSYFVNMEGDWQFNQVHACEIARLQSALEAAEGQRIDAVESDLRNRMLLEDAEEKLTAATARAEAMENRIKEYRAKVEELEQAKANYHDKWLNEKEKHEELVLWRWLVEMQLTVQAMASSVPDKPYWAVLDVDGECLGEGPTAVEAINESRKLFDVTALLPQPKEVGDGK